MILFESNDSFLFYIKSAKNKDNIQLLYFVHPGEKSSKIILNAFNTHSTEFCNAPLSATFNIKTNRYRFTRVTDSLLSFFKRNRDSVLLIEIP